HGTELLRRCQAQIVAVTLDDEGAIVFEQGVSPRRTTCQPAPNSQAAGAGDTYLSAFALALGASACPQLAADMAAAAARVVVGKSHTSTCSADDLLASLGDEFRPYDLGGLG